jgi:hypothetical protein
VTLNRETEKVFRALDDLAHDPNTLLALNDARDALSVLRPFINYVAPFQTVCNDAVYFFTGLSGDVGFDTSTGTAQAALLKTNISSQDNQQGTIFDRPPDVPKNANPRGTKYPGDPLGQTPWQALHTQAYPPAIDAQGNADCQAGQEGYITGPLNGPFPDRGAFDSTYAPASVSNPQDPSQVKDFDEHKAGGSHTVNQMNLPGLRGPTRTGVPNIRDVP